VKSKKSSAPVISNAGPLIHLAKVSALHLLEALYKIIVIPREVRVETVNRGKEEGAPDALQIEGALKEGWIKTEEVKLNKDFLKAAKIAGLQTAEAAVIQYAYQNQAIALLDDEPARTFAKTLGIPIRGTLGILVEAVKRGLISRKEALEKLDELSEIMYLSAELYKLVRRNIQRAS
jgi:predicted nucleic acid-binding protein